MLRTLITQTLCALTFTGWIATGLTQTPTPTATPALSPSPSPTPVTRSAPASKELAAITAQARPWPKPDEQLACRRCGGRDLQK
jgi:hypothetical protein